MLKLDEYILELNYLCIFPYIIIIIRNLHKIVDLQILKKILPQTIKKAAKQN